MRARLQNDDSGQTFSDQLLAIGNGKIPVLSLKKFSNRWSSLSLSSE